MALSASSTSCPQFRPGQLNLATGTPIGSGAISHVLKTTLQSPPIPVVIKILSKVQLLQQRRVESALNEKTALVRAGPHPFIARLYGTAQSEDELYFVMEWLPHGDLLQHIRRTAAKRVKEYSATHGAASAEGTTAGASSTATHPSNSAVPPSAKDDGTPIVTIPASSTTLRCLDFHDIQLITAQIIMGLARANEKGLVLRDLKPENVAFDSKYRAVLIDFDTVDPDGANQRPETNGGVAVRRTHSIGSPEDDAARRRLTVSEIQNMRKRTASFCGTAQYVSPEMVGQCKWSFSSDLWALGTVVYEMLYGVHLFPGISQYAVLQEVIKGAAKGVVPFPVVDLGEDGDAFERVKDFILRLVEIDPHKRLGVRPITHTFDLTALQQHALFRGFDWAGLEEQVRLFRPRTFALEGEATPEGDATACNSTIDPDPSPSLQSRYHELPFNDPDYAKYVYECADANPFERFLQHILLSDTSDTHETAAKSVESTAPPAAATAAADDEQGNAADTEDDVEIVDDVGIRYCGRSADPDFRL